MRQSIEIVLRLVTEGHRVDTFPEQFSNRVANAIIPPGVIDVLSDVGDQSESMVSFAKQHDTGVGSESMVSGLHFDAAVEFRLKKVILTFTQCVILIAFLKSLINSLNAMTHAMMP